jgi:hypothetical protein
VHHVGLRVNRGESLIAAVGVGGLECLIELVTLGGVERAMVDASPPHCDDQIGEPGLDDVGEPAVWFQPKLRDRPGQIRDGVRQRRERQRFDEPVQTQGDGLRIQRGLVRVEFLRELM